MRACLDRNEAGEGGARTKREKRKEKKKLYGLFTKGWKLTLFLLNTVLFFVDMKLLF